MNVADFFPEYIYHTGGPGKLERLGFGSVRHGLGGWVGTVSLPRRVEGEITAEGIIS
jgi:hypothetical protein